MAKDPAFLFYPGDWMGGTVGYTRHQKGCYIDLLIAQFNIGPLSLETIKTVLGTDQAVWTVLSKKFQQDSEGNFFNEKLATEILKRKAFTESRKENGKNGGRPPNKPYVKPYAKATDNRTENEDENENSVSNPVLWTDEVQNFKNDFRWREKFCRDKNIRLPDFEVKITEFLSDLELKEDYKDLKELKRHFTNWFNKHTNANRTTHKRDTTTAGRDIEFDRA